MQMSDEDKLFNRIAVRGGLFGCLLGPFAAFIWGLVSSGLGVMMLGSGFLAIPGLVVVGVLGGGFVGAIIGTVVANIVVPRRRR